MNKEQLQQMRQAPGFVGALDQSGGSTPKALKAYGIQPEAYDSEEKMFELIHQMRARMITSTAFSSRKVIGVILFERTMRSQIEGMPTADFLWQKRNIVPFLKVDKGLQEEANGVQLMKPFPELGKLCDEAVSYNIFGTKMRSVIKQANEQGIRDIVAQQFAWGREILSHGLMPILEPEVDIHCPDKEKAEEILKKELLAELNKQTEPVMLKITLPTVDNFYKEIVEHPMMLRVVALSGGYSREEANTLLGRNHGIIASFSRALAEGLTVQQSDEEFNRVLEATVDSVYEASIK
ncbi:fructose bisphosphate aldolase [Porphyromonas circumdentaria]|uniref:Fructose-bisphosphate aldolase class 1 n=1 Tax=Porphyromonas circumdentaria TaxID=29524 RepID=A0A1T4Q8J5_9PORP|nr:fructose bisphosphate aldolase [Porphyromonas circumdentaria]MBB6276634.1 fructose-bisphosphate aldolase class I [Porphyromonas circumdentaria]MDO4722247.1 fructose bisphosphate aldolase [Porphyromonas circumdentaria]SKA00092.1 fructose-bisphosphate aldolase, class I [Porphyromonas circumdentaria]